MPTRSAKLAVLRPAANVGVVAYTVPANTTVILKSISVVNMGGAGDTVTVVSQNVAGRNGFAINGQVLASSGTAFWSGWLVMGPTDSIVVVSVTGLSDFWISGTILPGVA